jgi:tetratricopeptide (TPR) repeat protein
LYPKELFQIEETLREQNKRVRDFEVIIEENRRHIDELRRQIAQKNDVIDALQARLSGGRDWDRDRMEADALKAALKAVKHRPGDAYAWHNLGVAYSLEDRWPDAADAFRKAIQLGLPRRFFWYQFRALWALNRVGDYQRVLELTEPVVEEAPSIAEVRVARGDAYMGLGERQEAEEEYRAALKYQPTCKLAKVRLFALTGGCAGKNHNRWLLKTPSP